ncbi:MAG: hypothetical protein H6710_18485 [Myxococcales bacterium]|nr:hypothetical protein [Myxococcales bacterium]
MSELTGSTADAIEAELVALRAEVARQEEALAELQRALDDREEELARRSSGAAEPGEARVAVDIAVDRDRLRDELARRTTDLQAAEERLWQANEAAQKERIENVRLVAEVDRLREQVERSRVVERDGLKEIEALGHELRRVELANAELQGLIESKTQRLRELEATVQGGPGDDDTDRLRADLRAAQTELEQARSREQAGSELERRREREVAEAQATIGQLRRTVDDYAATAANLRGELVVIQVEVEQLHSLVPTLQQQVTELRAKVRGREDEAALLQQRLEEAASEQRHLRQRLLERRREIDDIAGERARLLAEIEGVRAELKACKDAMSQLQIAEGGAGGEGLRAELAAQARAFAVELERIEARRESLLEQARGRQAMAELEATVRAEEQEHLLFRLDTCEQRIWEMTDASDRSAARLAAGLAQYAKQREQLEDLVHELEVTRNLLADAEARVAELERNLAGERARQARQGGGEGEIAREPEPREVIDEAAPLREVDVSSETMVDEVFAQAEAEAEERLQLDEELMRLTDAILDGESELQPMGVAARSDDEYDRELEEILGSDDDLAPLTSLGLGSEVDRELLMDVEEAMAESRAVEPPAKEPEPEPEPIGDDGVIIEMLDEDGEWPADEVWPDGGLALGDDEVIGGGAPILEVEVKSREGYIDIDLFDEETGAGGGEIGHVDEDMSEEAGGSTPSAEPIAAEPEVMAEAAVEEASADAGEGPTPAAEEAPPSEAVEAAAEVAKAADEGAPTAAATEPRRRPRPRWIRRPMRARRSRPATSPSPRRPSASSPGRVSAGARTTATRCSATSTCSVSSTTRSTTRPRPRRLPRPRRRPGPPSPRPRRRPPPRRRSRALAPARRSA